jgi:hypothetical protein
METVGRRKLEMATRVVEFARAHPSTEPGHATVLARLEERLARARALLDEEREQSLGTRALNQRRLEIRQEIQSKYLHNLVRVGELVAKERPDLVGKFRLRSASATHLAFLVSTRAMLARAQAEKALFVGNGLAETLLDDLDKLAGDFETAGTAAVTGKRSRVGSRVELQQVAADLIELIKVLDSFNRYRFRADRRLQGEWNIARNVFGSLRSKAVTREPEGGDSPPAGGVAPAA